jgi:hypothetical protein
MVNASLPRPPEPDPATGGSIAVQRSARGRKCQRNLSAPGIGAKPRAMPGATRAAGSVLAPGASPGSREPMPIEMPKEPESRGNPGEFADHDTQDEFVKAQSAGRSIVLHERRAAPQACEREPKEPESRGNPGKIPATMGATNPASKLSLRPGFC